MQVVEGGVEAQAEQALKNLKAVVEAGGAELGKVVKTTVSIFPFSFSHPLFRPGFSLPTELNGIVS